MCKTKYTLPLPAEWLDAPAVVAFWLITYEELAKRFHGQSKVTMRYTEDIEAAKRWIDQGLWTHHVRMVKAWRLPTGELVFKDPKDFSGAIFSFTPCVEETK